MKSKYNDLHCQRFCPKIILNPSSSVYSWVDSESHILQLRVQCLHVARLKIANLDIPITPTLLCFSEEALDWWWITWFSLSLFYSFFRCNYRVTEPNIKALERTSRYLVKARSYSAVSYPHIFQQPCGFRILCGLRPIFISRSDEILPQHSQIAYEKVLNQFTLSLPEF